MVCSPRRMSVSSIFGPTPHSRRTGSGARKAASPPGGTTTRPSGLRMSDATLATIFEEARPTDAVSCVSAHDRLLQSRRQLFRGARRRLAAGAGGAQDGA